MKPNQLWAFLLFSFLFVNNATAQKRKVDKSKSTQKEKPAKKGESSDVQVFDSADKADENQYFEKKKNSNPLNVVKIAPLEILEGMFTLSYERVVSSRMSVEANLGITTVSESQSILKSGLFGKTDYEGFAKPQSGTCFGLGVKFYLSKNDLAPDGGFIAIETRVRSYNFDAYPFVGGNRASAGPYQKTTVTDADLLRVIFGYQTDGEYFSWTPYAGLGYRKHTFTGWYEENDDSSTPVLGSKSESKPVFLFGIKMGLRF